MVNLKSSLGRFYILYVAFALIWLAAVDVNKIKAKTLNVCMPSSFQKLIDVSERKSEPTDQALKEYLLYFRKTKEYLPSWDAYALLGFCYGRLGEREKAIANYSDALEINPYFFPIIYNMGLHYFEMGKYKDATRVLEEVRTVNFGAMVPFMYASKIYQALMGYVASSETEMQIRMKTFYIDTYALLTLSAFYDHNWDKVIGYSKEALEKEMDMNGFFQYFLGSAAYQKGDYKMTVLLMAHMLKRNPRNSDANSYLELAIKKIKGQEFSEEDRKTEELLRNGGNSRQSLAQKFHERIF